MDRKTTITVFGLAGAFFFFLFLLPIVTTIKEAFFLNGYFTLDYVFEVFRNPLYLEGLRNALLLGLASTLASMAIAMPLALAADGFRFPLKGALTTLLLVPLILPPFVGAIGVKQVFGIHGSCNALLIGLDLMDPARPIDWLGQGRFGGIVLMNALHLYPIIYLNFAAALANLDPAMDEAAENLGCPAWRRFVSITLPLTMPGLFAGGTIVFIWSFTELGVPLIFDYTRVTSVQIFDGIKDLSGNPIPYALVAVMLACTTLLYAASRHFFGRSQFVMTGRAAIAHTARSLPAWRALLCTGAFIVVILLAMLPHAGVVFASIGTDWYDTVIPAQFSPANYHAALGHEITVPSIANSLKYASVSTLLDIVLGVVIAYLVVRTRLPGREVLDALAMLPLAVPGLVLAFGYLAMTREGKLFDWLLPGENPAILLVIAYAVRRLPYVVRSAAAGFQQTSVTLEEAARNLGAPTWRAMCLVTLPLIAANLIAGGLLAFAFAMLEVSDSLILAQKQEHYPITKAIYGLFSSLGDGPYLAAALGVWCMVFLGVTVVLASLLLGKKLGALFRV